MSATATILYQRQYQAMMNEVMGYGESLAKFMATQSAVPVLAEDWRKPARGRAVEISADDTPSLATVSFVCDATCTAGPPPGTRTPATWRPPSTTPPPLASSPRQPP